jgi:hypothetical protein
MRLGLEHAGHARAGQVTLPARIRGLCQGHIGGGGSHARAAPRGAGGAEGRTGATSAGQAEGCTEGGHTWPELRPGE